MDEDIRILEEFVKQRPLFDAPQIGYHAALIGVQVDEEATLFRIGFVARKRPTLPSSPW